MLLSQCFRYTVAGSLAVAFVSACGPVDTVAEKSSDVKIIGGSEVKDLEDHPSFYSTVALTTEKRLGEGKSFCSGTLVASNVVLTAAHCLVDQDYKPFPEETYVVFGNRVKKDATYRKIAKAVAHPDFDFGAVTSPFGRKPGNDIGLVFLEDDAPESHKPVEVFSGKYEKKQRFTLAGFGVSFNRLWNNTGVLRRIDMKLEGEDTEKQRIRISGFFQGACAGDSGGPVYLQDAEGKWSVTAVTSAGMELIGTCLGVGFYTDARYYVDWIKESIANR